MVANSNFGELKTRWLKRFSPSDIGMLFGLVTLLLNICAHDHPAFIEHWYTRGFFQFIRRSLDWTTGLLPFPSFYLFWGIVLAFWFWLYRRRPRVRHFWPKLRYWLARLAGFAGLLLGLFFWMWGFNYARIPVETQLGLVVRPIDSMELWREFRAETYAVDSLRRLLVGNDTTALNDKRLWPNHAEDTVRAAVEKWMAGEGFPVGGRVRGRFIYPQGTLFKFGAAGIYWPFVGEGNVEAGLHPLRKLPAMAHEMSHGYGFCDEGVCNFIAYVACAGQSNTYLAYCARLDYWNTLAHACRRGDPKRFEHEYLPAIPAGILADEEAIRIQNDKFQELAPDVRYAVYDSYLKAQGIGAGMLSYEEVVMWVRAWRVKQARSLF